MAKARIISNEAGDRIEGYYDEVLVIEIEKIKGKWHILSQESAKHTDMRFVRSISAVIYCCCTLVEDFERGILPGLNFEFLDGPYGISAIPFLYRQNMEVAGTQPQPKARTERKKKALT